VARIKDIEALARPMVRLCCLSLQLTQTTWPETKYRDGTTPSQPPYLALWSQVVMVWGTLGDNAGLEPDQAGGIAHVEVPGIHEYNESIWRWLRETWISTENQPLLAESRGSTRGDRQALSPGVRASAIRQNARRGKEKA